MSRIPMKWLARHVDLPENLTASELAQALVKVGLEEEEIHPGAVTGPIVVGKVLTREAKEQSNGKVINYCRVDVGPFNDEPGTGKEPSDLPSRGIICGAHNFDVGDFVVVSLPGAVLPGDFVIAARKTYGHISDGMICSSRELGIGDDHDGIIVLARNGDEEKIATLPAPGENALPLLGIVSETLEINITPDRGYCFSMRGVGREYHHSTGAAFTDLGLEENLSTPLPQSQGDGFSVSIHDDAPIHGNAGCDRYVARIVRGVNPQAPTPLWIKQSLEEAGMRSISLAVDITNYVMFDLGQPLHAFDLNRLHEPIVVRRAQSGEKLTTLDGIERSLDVEDLVISDSPLSDGNRAIALAGVMGGEETEINDETTDILIEAAHFDPVSIARSSRRHKLPSEAAKRYERSVDPLIAAVAAHRAVELLVEYGGGEADELVTDVSDIHLPEPIVFSLGSVERLTGLQLEKERIVHILQDIGCVVEDADDDLHICVTPPSWRPDLIGDAYLVEEVARLVGYDEIPICAPSAHLGNGLSVAQRARRDAMRSLAELGWVQVLSYPFVGEVHFDKQGIEADDMRRKAIRLANPLQEEAPYMRTSILDSLLEAARLNVSRGHDSVAICESSFVSHAPQEITSATVGVGKRPSDEELRTLTKVTPVDPFHIAGVACGKLNDSYAGYEGGAWDWRDAIQAVKSIADILGVGLNISSAQYSPWHPGRCAVFRAGNKVIGYAGELHPRVCRQWELPARAVAFEIDFDLLINESSRLHLDVAPVFATPAVKEDLAFVVDTETSAGDVESVIRQAAGDQLENIFLFDVYEGKNLGENKKSLAFSLRLRTDHTLETSEVNALRKRIIKKVSKQCKAELRS
ncbi:MAG: phenylalanine--tRNA ligase subunit beta [Actinomycetaceae bacterium]|nr:phenylalanine--tRNA ligase subunit beta [Actinomycetaceae bacterium]